MKKLIFSILILPGFMLNGQNLSNLDKEAKDISNQIIRLLNQEEYLKINYYFNEELKGQLDEDKIALTHIQIKKDYGDYIGNIDFDKKVTAEKTFYLRGMEFSRKKLDLIFSIDKDRKLTVFRIAPYSIKPDWKVPSYVNTDLFEIHDQKIGKKMPLLAEMTKSSKTMDFVLTVLVHGSGPNDMDGTVGPNKLFKDLAYGLGSNKISTLRYNKRSYDYPTYLQGNIMNLKIDNVVVDDAVEAIKKARELGATKVILIGHSLGAHMAPKIAEIAKPDAVILLAGNVSPLEDLIIPQVEHIMKHDPSSAINEFQYNALKFQVENLKKRKYDEATIGELPFNLPGTFWKSLQDYDPRSFSKKQDIPYLILNGGRDYQVSPKEAKKWKNGNKHEHSKTIIYPKLNHLFYSGEGILIPSEYEREAHMDEAVLTDIVKWIQSL